MTPSRGCAATSRRPSWPRTRIPSSSSASRSAPAPRSYAAERGLDAVWLTPLPVDPAVAEAIAANAGRQLLVGGLADDLWDSSVARELAERAARCSSCRVPITPCAPRAMSSAPRSCRST
jgi:hypothetical protein